MRPAVRRVAGQLCLYLAVAGLTLLIVWAIALAAGVTIERAAGIR